MDTRLLPGMRMPGFISTSAFDGAEKLTVDGPWERQIILLLPEEMNSEILSNLARFKENLPSFAELKTRVVVILPRFSEDVTQLVSQADAGFTFLEYARAFATTSDQFSLSSEILPLVIIIDGQGFIHSVFDGERYPSLPNPMAVLRAVRRLESAPRPHPVSANDWLIGPSDAKVVLIEYSDYQCPHCLQLHKVIHQVMEEFGGKVALVHRHLPLRHSHPLAQQAAEAAEAAGSQGKFWEMHHRLMSADCVLERDDLIQYAKEVGLDVPRFITDLDQRTFQAEVNEDFRQAVDHLIKLPPSLFLNSVLLDAPVTLEGLREKIQTILG